MVEKEAMLFPERRGPRINAKPIRRLERLKRLSFSSLVPISAMIVLVVAILHPVAPAIKYPKKKNQGIVSRIPIEKSM